MVVGFNHNIRVRGELFHVQTEDSGRANPHIVTLLYHGGTIIGSAKTSYADIIKTDQLELVVESIMKDQHKEMMRRLKNGEFDSRIAAAVAVSPALPGAPHRQTTSAAPAAAPPAAHLAPRAPASPTAAPAPSAGGLPAASGPPAPIATRSLDEVILDYLITGTEK